MPKKYLITTPAGEYIAETNDNKQAREWIEDTNHVIRYQENAIKGQNDIREMIHATMPGKDLPVFFNIGDVDQPFVKRQEKAGACYIPQSSARPCYG